MIDSLLQPLMLFGAVGLAVPLVIHLLNKSKFKVEYWGAMMFLEDAVKLRAQRLKMEQWWLLLLRMLFFIGLALAMSRPITEPSQGLTGHQATTHVLILDGSYSMRQGSGEAQLFEQMRANALAMVDSLNEDDNMLVIVAQQKPRVLFPKPIYDKKLLRAKLGTLKAGEGTANMRDALQEAFWRLEESTLTRHRITVMTDRQTLPWAMSRDALWNSVTSHRETLRIPPSIYVLSHEPEREIQNLSVADLRALQPLQDTFRLTRFQVDVDNTGDESQEIKLEFRVDGRYVSERDEIVAPGRQTFFFDHQFTDPGNHSVEVILLDDAFTWDNRRALSVDVKASIPVLVVEGRSHSQALRADGGVIELALSSGALPGSDGLFSVTRMNQQGAQELDTQDLRSYRVVVMANVHALSPVFQGRLERFAERGGGVLIGLGPQVTSDEYNDWYQGDEGFLPAKLARLERVDGAAKQPQLPGGVVQSMLALMDLSRTQVLNDVQVRQYWQLEAASASQPLAMMGQDPFWVYKPYGDGRVMMLASSLTLDWSNFPATQHFLPLLHSSVAYLAASVQPPINLDQGETLIYNLPWRLRKDHEGDLPSVCTIGTPSGKTHQVNISLEGDEFLATWNNTDEPGIYTVEADGFPIKQFAVALDTRESEFTDDGDALKDFVKSTLNADMYRSYRSMQSAVLDETQVKEWWHWLILLIMGVLVVELYVGWRFNG